MVRDLYDDAKAEPSLMERVKEVQANLDVKFPTFVKLVIRSNVNIGFLLNFPRTFSEMHMPGHDATVVLVDPSQKEYRAKYLVWKNMLSAGWRSFSVAHKLIVGDVLVFQLIKHCKFKVYIVRTSELDEVDGANALLHLKADTRRCNSEITNEATSISNTSRARNLSLSNHDGFTSRRESSKALEEACPSVGSLHARLDRLDSLALEEKEAVEIQKDRRTMPGRVQTEEEQKTLQ
ncbi:B3 domain-containing protein [Actinidia chinensis var. chinensis]|uniref:B3 domain-containing protein n=1 Tax=Actinidia chinensis var. chinensis TaxID=1590841 RepID=A0A2R6RH37_ACTCC|nr:B3 domain-containing protein [Actinidia chinensis var. chinensis]